MMARRRQFRPGAGAKHPFLHAALALGAVLVARGARADGAVVQKQLGSTTSPWGYLEYLPPGYDTSPSDTYPLIVQLCGIGELGNGTTDLGKVGIYGPIKAVTSPSSYFELNHVIVIAPQASDQWEFDPQQTAMAQFFTYLLAVYRVDPKRVYLTGLSSGGGGVYTFVGGAAAQGVIAACIPVCGNQDPYDSFIPYAKNIPMWSFQNWGDPTNSRTRAIGFTQKIADALSGNASLNEMTNYPNQNGDPTLSAAGTETALFDGSQFTWDAGILASGPSELRLTLYNANVHDAWTATYASNDVWDWLLRHGAVTTPPPDGGSDDAGTSTQDGGATLQDAGSTGPDGGSVGTPDAGDSVSGAWPLVKGGCSAGGSGVSGALLILVALFVVGPGQLRRRS